MSGIRSALISHHPVGTLSEDIDKLTLPFVTPLRTNDYHCARLRIEHAAPVARRFRRSSAPGASVKDKKMETPRTVARGVDSIYGARLACQSADQNDRLSAHRGEENPRS